MSNHIKRRSQQHGIPGMQWLIGKKTKTKNRKSPKGKEPSNE